MDEHSQTYDWHVGRQQLLRLPHPAIEQGGAAQMAHPGLDRLQPHEDVGLGLFPGPVQLLLGGTLVRQLGDNGTHRLQGGLLLLPAQAGVDTQKAGVGVVGDVGIHGQTILPHILDFPAQTALPLLKPETAHKNAPDHNEDLRFHNQTYFQGYPLHHSDKFLDKRASSFFHSSRKISII